MHVFRYPPLIYNVQGVPRRYYPVIMITIEFCFVFVYFLPICNTRG